MKKTMRFFILIVIIAFPLLVFADNDDTVKRTTVTVPPIGAFIGLFIVMLVMYNPKYIVRELVNTCNKNYDPDKKKNKIMKYLSDEYAEKDNLLSSLMNWEHRKGKIEKVEVIGKNEKIVSMKFGDSVKYSFSLKPREKNEKKKNANWLIYKLNWIKE